MTIPSLPCLPDMVQMERIKVEALPSVVPGHGCDEEFTVGHGELVCMSASRAR